MNLDKMKRYYEEGFWSINRLKTLLAAGKITQEDYNYDLECGVGNLDVGSDSYSGLGREKSISNTGADRKVDLECGMGNVSVNFSGKEHRDLQMS